MSDPDQAISATLLDRLRANDQAAWSRLVRLYNPLVRFWAGRRGVTGADADDAVQEVFRVVAVGLVEFHRDRPGASFRGWLRGITRFVLLRHANQTARHPPAAGGTTALRDLHVIPAEPADDDPPEEIGALFRRGLELVRSEFEPRTWQMFWEHTVEGKAVADVATAMSTSTAAVRQAKYRVLTRLRAEFNGLVEE